MYKLVILPLLIAAVSAGYLSHAPAAPALAIAAPAVHAAPVATSHASIVQYSVSRPIAVHHSAPVAIGHAAPVAIGHAAPVAIGHAAPVAIGHAASTLALAAPLPYAAHGHGFHH